MLCFDDQSLPGSMSALFDGLSGLEHVKHVDLNHRQAMLMETILLSDTNGARNGADMQEISFRFKGVSNLHEIGFRYDDGVPTNPDNPQSRPRCEHFIPKHFGHIHDLRISFHDAPWGAIKSAPARVSARAAALAAARAALEGPPIIHPGDSSAASCCRRWCCRRDCDCKAVSFDLRPTTAPRTKAAAYAQLRKYRDLWSRLRDSMPGFWFEYDARHLDDTGPLDAPRLLFYRDPDMEAIGKLRELFWGTNTFAHFARGALYIQNPRR